MIADTTMTRGVPPPLDWEGAFIRADQRTEELLAERKQYEEVVTALRGLLKAARDPKQFGLGARCVDADDALAGLDEKQSNDR